jgi:HEAT repeat protein
VGAFLYVVALSLAAGAPQAGEQPSSDPSKRGLLALARTIEVEVDPGVDARLGPKTWPGVTEGLLRLTRLRVVRGGADVTLRLRPQGSAPDPSPNFARGELALLANGAVLFTQAFWVDPDEAARSKRDGRFEIDRMSSALVLILMRSFGLQVFQAGVADADPQVRLVSIWVLALRKDFRATAPLLAMLEDSRPAARWTAAEALGKLKDPSAAPSLIAHLRREEDRTAKGYMARALGSIGDPRAIGALVAATEDPRPDVRQFAVTALGSFTDPRATAALRKALHSESSVVAGTAMIALGKGGVEAVQEGLADKDPAARVRAADQLGSANDKRAVGALVAALGDPVPEVRHHAAIALFSIGDPKAFVPLSTHLQDPAPLVREMALRGVLKLALAALAQGSPAQRIAVVKTVAALEGQQADELVAKGLYDASEDVRLAAIRGMGRRPIPMASSELTEVASADKSPGVRDAARGAAMVPIARFLSEGTVTDRRAAAQYLGRLRDPRGLVALAAAVHDRDAEVRLEVVRALGKTGTADAIPPLALMRADSVVYVRLAVVDALRSIPDPRAVPPLLSALEDPLSEVRWRAVEALQDKTSDGRVVDGLLRTVQDPVGGVRAPAAFALAAAKDPAIVPRLVPLMASSDEHVRTAAAVRLRQDPQKEAVMRLCALLAHADAIVRRDVSQLLGEMRDPQAVPPLIERLHDPDPGVKRAAMAALARFDDPRAVEALAAQRGAGPARRP